MGAKSMIYNNSIMLNDICKSQHIRPVHHIKSCRASCQDGFRYADPPSFACRDSLTPRPAAALVALPSRPRWAWPET